MKLSECYIGQIVETDPKQLGDKEKRVGHITGLARNATGEIVPEVHFVRDYLSRNSYTVAMHHDNLRPYQE